MERQSNDVSLARFVAFDAIHQGAHEEQAATILALEISRPCGVHGARVEVEPGALISDLEYQRVVAHDGADADMLVSNPAVAAQDRVAQGLRERHGHVQRTLPRGERELPALTSYLFDDRLDLANVARYEPVDGNVRMCGAAVLSAVSVSSH